MGGDSGIPGLSRAFQPWRCGDLRAWAGASGALLRDRRGMDSLSSSQTNASFLRAMSAWATMPTSLPRWRSLSGCLRTHRADRSIGFAVPVVEPFDPCHQTDPSEVELVRPRVIRDVVRLARAVEVERQGRL